MIRIAKVNDGIIFTACTKKGAPVSKNNKALEGELRRACDWYEEQVCEAFEREGLRESGYARDFMNYRFKMEKISNGIHVGIHYFLEPWGFADRNEAGEPVMGNSGSTPTTGRAKVLLCYQAPLERKVDENGNITFSILKSFP